MVGKSLPYFDGSSLSLVWSGSVYSRNEFRVSNEARVRGIGDFASIVCTYLQTVPASHRSAG